MFVSEGNGPVGGTAATAAAEALTGALAGAVSGLLELEPDELSDAQLAAAMLDLRREQSRLAAALAELTAAFDARRAWADDGSRSAIDWIAVRARLPRRLVAGEVRDARRLRTMSATQAAFQRGDLSPAHVRSLSRLAGHPRAGEHFAEGEQLLVSEAVRSRFDDWQRLCAHWRDAADPDGPEQRRARDHDLRRFTLATGLDGVSHPDGYLTSLAATTVGGALERIERELFDTDWAAAKAVHGDEVTPAHLARTPAQRRHDALVEMAERAMAAPADGKRPAPLVTVLVDYPTLAGRVCELAGTGTVVAPGDVLELLARDDTLIERVVFDGASQITDISRARTFRGTLRRILDLTDRHCGHDTCFVPAHRCQGDHVVPWSHGGPTTAANGRLRCGYHNRWAYTHEQTTPPARSPEAPVDPPAVAHCPPPRWPTAMAPSESSPPTPPGPHWVLRMPRRRQPDLDLLSDSQQWCAIDVHPARARPDDMPREYLGQSIRRAA